MGITSFLVVPILDIDKLSLLRHLSFVVRIGTVTATLLPYSIRKIELSKNRDRGEANGGFTGIYELDWSGLSIMMFFIGKLITAVFD